MTAFAPMSTPIVHGSMSISTMDLDQVDQMDLVPQSSSPSASSSKLIGKYQIHLPLNLADSQHQAGEV